jgi:hypothetical protein
MLPGKRYPPAQRLRLQKGIGVLMAVLSKISWIIVGISIMGVLLNIKKNKWGFVCWIISNAAWVVIDYRAGLHSQAFLFFIYFLLAIWGILAW